MLEKREMVSMRKKNRNIKSTGLDSPLESIWTLAM